MANADPSVSTALSTSPRISAPMATMQQRRAQWPGWPVPSRSVGTQTPQVGLAPRPYAPRPFTGNVDDTIIETLEMRERVNRRYMSTEERVAFVRDMGVSVIQDTIAGLYDAADHKLCQLGFWLAMVEMEKEMLGPLGSWMKTHYALLLSDEIDRRQRGESDHFVEGTYEVDTA